MVSADDSRQTSLNVRPEQELKLANDEWARALAERDKAALDRIM